MITKLSKWVLGAASITAACGAVLYVSMDTTTVAKSADTQKPEVFKLPEGDMNGLPISIGQLEIQSQAVTMSRVVVQPTYNSSDNSHLSSVLTHTEDQTPKVRYGGYRYQKVSSNTVGDIKQHPEQGHVQENKSLSTVFTAGGQATNIANAGGYMFIPADSHGAVGPNHVVNVFNTSIEFYDKDGSNGVSTSLQSFFASLNPVNFTFDPKVVYDQHAGRWVVVTLQRTDTLQGDSSNSSNVFIAVSDDSNPHGNWHMLDIDTKENIGGLDRWFDYPGLSVDEEVIYLTGNMFGFGNNEEITAQLQNTHNLKTILNL